mmetsp:Transcript_50294/g.109528  ORF Transcript_50294/g.109528 Transcript_50294/m.109528 type:complete len:305 (+) Transcript_50294:45-959(+)
MLAASLRVPDHVPHFPADVPNDPPVPTVPIAPMGMNPPASSAAERAESLKALRGLVGPHASSAQLKNQLQRFSNDPRKAANGYFRSACACDLPFDFQPRPLCRNSSAAAFTGPRHALSWLDLDVQLFPAPAFLQIVDCWALLPASREVNQRVIHQEAFWAAAFQSVFLEVPYADVASAAPGVRGSSVMSASFLRFTERWRQELGRVCPKCAARQAIVPIVYGFPSAPLTAHYRRGALVLTEVCGFLGPCWACRRCHFEFEQYPYVGDLQPVGNVVRKYPFLRVCLAADGAVEESEDEEGEAPSQ